MSIEYYRVSSTIVGITRVLNVLCHGSSPDVSCGSPPVRRHALVSAVSLSATGTASITHAITSQSKPHVCDSVYASVSNNFHVGCRYSAHYCRGFKTYILTIVMSLDIHFYYTSTLIVQFIS